MLVALYYSTDLVKALRSQPPRLIAHAAGALNGRTYTNSREAFDANYTKGHRYFEADFSWTSDAKLVLIHDWTATFIRWFNAKGLPTLKQFKSINMKHQMTQMTLDDLYSWLLEHKDAYIVTDVKTNNVAALRMISGTAGKLKERFIPQIYALTEFKTVRQLGFKDIILTLYRLNLPDEEILEFVNNNELFAVTMPAVRAMSTSLAKNLKKKDVFVFAHTINSLEIWEKLQYQGVSGIYTDFLTQTDLAKMRKFQRYPIPSLKENLKVPERVATP